MDTYNDRRKHISQMTSQEIKVLRSKLMNIEYFNFTDYSLNKVKHRNISKYNVIGAIRNGDIIEAHNNKLGDVRILLRCDINNISVCVVISLKKELIVTAYLNNINDNHETLNRDNYKWNAVITNRLIKSIID